MPDRDIIRYESPSCPQGPETVVVLSQGLARARGVKPDAAPLKRRGWLMPAPAEDSGARNPARLMRGPTDHQADSQSSSHQAR